MLNWFRQLGRRSQKAVSHKPRTLKEKIRQKYDHLYVGQVIHYYSKIKVGIIRVEKGRLRLGDMVYFQGSQTRFKQKVTSLEYNHQKVKEVGPGYEVGVEVGACVRSMDDVYLLKT